MTEWNYGLMWKGIAERDPERPAQRFGDRIDTWGGFHARANALAADMVSAGIGRGAKVAQYLHNCPEYLESVFGSFLGGFVPVNTNYRYGADEIAYLFDNSDAEAVVFHGAFAPLLAGVRGRLPGVKRWYMVADDSLDVVPEWATDYAMVVGSPVDEVVPASPLTGDDLLFLYTGGTTGMPKGVMWRHEDLITVLGRGAHAIYGIPEGDDVDELIARVGSEWPSHTTHVACPLMHGTGQFSAFIALALAGAVSTSVNRTFDAVSLWDDVSRHRASAVVIVGQAFAGPMLESLDASPGRWDLSSILQMGSSGVMWSQDNKEGLLEHIPQMVITDTFGSSEAIGMGTSVAAKGRALRTAQFTLGPNCVVFTEDGRRVEPGSGDRGLVAVGGAIPLGYYKDEAKTAQTFRVFEGRRWTVPGDWAEVNEDGTLHLLGRGSVCINTGGEKVFPEEVEECLKTHAAVRDAVAVGVPDPRFGEAICAVVEATPTTVPDLAALKEHVASRLAPYKAPRHLVVVDTIGRAANGKVDYARLRAHATDVLGTA